MRTAVVAGAGLLALAAGVFGCGKDGASDLCTIEYELLGRAASDRQDVVIVGDEEGAIKRLVREEGDDVTAAIYYRFVGDEVSPVAEELDDRDNGRVNARLTRTQRLVDLIDIYQVDADTDDDQLDTVQISVQLPTSSFGPWAPARVFYAMNCGPDVDITAERVGDIVTLLVDIGRDGEVDTEMRFYVVNGGLTGWVIDHGIDGIIDARAVIGYTSDGLVETVTWRDWEFRPTHIGRWAYEGGVLRTYEEDARGDGEVDNRIAYSAQCFEEVSP